MCKLGGFSLRYYPDDLAYFAILYYKSCVLHMLLFSHLGQRSPWHSYHSQAIHSNPATNPKFKQIWSCQHNKSNFACPFKYVPNCPNKYFPPSTNVKSTKQQRFLPSCAQIWKGFGWQIRGRTLTLQMWPWYVMMTNRLWHTVSFWQLQFHTFKICWWKTSTTSTCAVLVTMSSMHKSCCPTWHGGRDHDIFQ